MLPLQLIPHSWASTSAAHVITCLTSFSPPVYKLNEGSNLVILFTVVSPIAVTLPGSETQERVVELMTTLIVKHPLSACSPSLMVIHDSRKPVGNFPGPSYKSLCEGKGSCLLMGQLPTV